MAEIDLTRNLVSNELAQEIFFRGFCYGLILHEIPSFLGPEICKWLNACRKTASWPILPDVWPIIFVRCISCIPRFNQQTGFANPARHHLIVSFRQPINGLYKDEGFSDFSPETVQIYNNHDSLYERFYEESHGLSLLAKTATTHL